MVKILIAIVVTQNALLLIDIVVAYMREKRHAMIIADLLDRIMARDYQSYSYTRQQNPIDKRKHISLSDEEMAELERQARGAK